MPLHSTSANMYGPSNLATDSVVPPGRQQRELVDEQRVISISNDSRPTVDPGTKLDLPWTWRIEFPGVVKLVRWVSGRSASKDKIDLPSAVPIEYRGAYVEPPKLRPRLSRVSFDWKVRSKMQSSKVDDINALERKDLVMPPTSSKTEPNISFSPSLSASKVAQRAVSSQPPNNSYVRLSSQDSSPPAVDPPRSYLRLNDLSTAHVGNSPASDALPKSLSSLPPEWALNRPAATSYLSSASQSHTELSVPSGVHRTLSLDAHFLTSMRDKLQRPRPSNSVRTVPQSSHDDRPRKLTKADSRRKSTRFTLSAPSSNGELSASSSPAFLSPAGATIPRKLSKREIPASAYAASHITDVRPPFLASLPEVRPLPNMVNLRLDKNPPKFQLGGEDGDDDNYHSYPSDDDRGLGSSPSLGTSWHDVKHSLRLHRRASLTYRRWSAAVADIPDDVDFLRELDRRLELGGASSIGIHDTGNSSTDESGEPGSGPSSGRWDATRRAMLCVREIIRTEKSYLAHLIRCNQSRFSGSPSLFFSHLPSLIVASQSFLSSMENDASTWGVATAFANAGNQLEEALVAWCSVVGDVIASPEGFPRSPSAPTAPLLSRDNAGPIIFPTRRFSAVSDDGHAYANNTRSSKLWRRGSLPGSSASLHSVHLRRSSNSPKELSLKDIAIMPTQRVSRYVMLFRDLLKQTPEPSKTYSVVDGALQHALRIARRCNDAQQNLVLNAGTL